MIQGCQYIIYRKTEWKTFGFPSKKKLIFENLRHYLREQKREKNNTKTDNDRNISVHWFAISFPLPTIWKSNDLQLAWPMRECRENFCQAPNAAQYFVRTPEGQKLLLPRPENTGSMGIVYILYRVRAMADFEEFPAEGCQQPKWH